MLKEFERALNAAMAGSTDVGHTLRSIQNSGYSLFLRVDCQRQGDSCQQITLSQSQVPEPCFRIDGRDLALLRSLGIDPTRRVRKRRTS
jgi:hypothetical protein